MVTALKKFWHSEWDKNIDRNKDDYSESQIFLVTVNSAKEYLKFLGSLVNWRILDSNLKIKKPFEETSPILFQHQIQEILVNPKGERAVLRHRFGPSKPDEDPEDPWMLADAWVSRTLTGKLPREVITFYPWFKTSLRKKPDLKRVETWAEEMHALAKIIQEETLFPPHPGERCLQCPYTNLCPTARLTGEEDSYTLLHDPVIRLTGRYLDLLRTRRETAEEIRQMERTFLEFAEKENRSVFRDIDGNPVLKVVDEYKLPRKGSSKWKALEKLLHRHGYTGSRDIGSILKWVNSRLPSKKDVEAIRECLVIVKRLATPERAKSKHNLVVFTPKR